jgi:uncharacterized damage-inducible protein DinB
MKRILCLSMFAIATPLAAQSVVPAATPSAPRAAVSAVATANTLWSGVSAYITQAAEQMTEANYSFRPTPEVRTFGQLIGHIAGSQYMYCALAIGDKAAGEGDIEKTKTSKADLVAAMKASNAYCNRAYAQTDADAQGTATVFGTERPRLFALFANATHDSEHYGNIVTYMRIKGMIPPSSQPAPARR